MVAFTYSSSAELYSARGGRKSRQKTPGYRRFAQAADAIRFAIEELPTELFRGAFLEVDEERYDSEGIRRLYEDTDYPLPRRSASL